MTIRDANGSKVKYPGWRTMTAAQRYNAKMDAIWEQARRLGAFDEANLKAAAEGLARLAAERLHAEATA